MPVVTEDTVKAYAHCLMPLCPGYRQQEVDALRRETGYLFTDNGGDLPGLERSKIDLLFADTNDKACPSCGKDRELTDRPRPSYQPLSGYDPMGLLNVGPFDPGKQQQVRDERVQELESKLAEQSAKLDRLLAAKDQGEDAVA